MNEKHVGKVINTARNMLTQTITGDHCEPLHQAIVFATVKKCIKLHGKLGSDADYVAALTDYFGISDTKTEDVKPVIDEYGTIRYYDSKRKLHRDGGPAIIWTDGEQTYYQHGKKHRDGDNPAVIHADGTRFWYINDKLHRGGGKPALIWANGSKEWWKHGEFIKKVNKTA